MQYQPQEIERFWQNFWSENATFQAEDSSEKPKYYVLDMFPYPSGAGLHVGHPLGYIVSDIVSRYKRHNGYNVLHPIGYDSFGLPAEQYAIQTGQHPATTTKVNIEGGIDKSGNTIKGYENQLKKIGLSYDWDRQFRTSDPSYYKWTQSFFIQLFESFYCKKENKAKPIQQLISHFQKEGNANTTAFCEDGIAVFSAKDWSEFDISKQSDILLQYRLAYLDDVEVNWCPTLGTVLANDEIVNGKSERGGYPVVQKKMRQWMIRITAYANRLLVDLEKLDWPNPIKEAQKNWIGKSTGAMISFNVKNSEKEIKVFSTRPDTIFGVSFMALAPELELVNELVTDDKKAEVLAYQENSAKKSERERMMDEKSISGVFIGEYAIHPFTGEEIPIWIGDYVLAGYGTGAVMAVPAGDDRDFDFAKHYNIPIKEIFSLDSKQEETEKAFTLKTGFTYQNSSFLDGFTYKEANTKIISELESIEKGESKVNFRLRNAVFSRQRYWGEPIPIYYKNGIPMPLSEKNLPLLLPEIEKYLPTETGAPPLGRAENWAWDEQNECICAVDKIDDKTIFPLELNTMPGWAGSSWYFNRYMDPNNENAFAAKEKLNYWKEVDLYLGGSEHATGHLLYSRFWQKFLFDMGEVPVDEYAKKLINQGMIQGESAFVHKIIDKNTFVSADLLSEYETVALHVDISIVDEKNNSLDLSKFQKWREEFAYSDFIYKNSKTDKEAIFLVSREVEKMSKSKYNVINPDDICEEYGADTLRMYEMFLGPIEQSKPWNTQGISGVHGFLRKYWKWALEVLEFPDNKTTDEENKILHQSIKKITEDIEQFSINTSISQFMIALNQLTKLKTRSKEVLEGITILISPFAPHIAEEIWKRMGNKQSISLAKWPIFDEKHLKESSFEYPVSFNGKVRFKISFPTDISKENIEKSILEEERTIKQLEGKSPKKIIVVMNRIINIVM